MQKLQFPSKKKIFYKIMMQMFQEAFEKAVEYKKNPVDIEDQIMEELENM